MRRLEGHRNRSSHGSRASGVRASLLLVLACGAASAQDVRFESDVNLVLSDVEVVDGDTGERIVSLTNGDFVVRDEGLVRKVKFLQHGVKGLDLVFVLDASAPNTHSTLGLAGAIDAAAGALWPEDRAAVLSFGSSIQVVSGFTSDSRDLRQAMRRVDRPRRRPGTQKPRILEALHEAEALLSPERRTVDRRSVVLAIAANDVALDPRKVDAVVARFLAAEITASCVIVERYNLKMGLTIGGVMMTPAGPVILMDKEVRPTEWEARRERRTLNAIVAATGGRMIREGQWVEGALTDALIGLRAGYVLGFHGAAGGDPAFRRISIDLSEAARRRYPAAVIRHREGYFPSGARPK